MWLSSGFSNDMQAVVYDRQGANHRGRLWWMLKWAGHDAVAVLDGGLQAWQAAGGAWPVATSPRIFKATLLCARRCAAWSQPAKCYKSGQPTQTVVDARATPRYRGETEPLDPVAGHIPGALNRPWPEPGFRRLLQARSTAARRVR